MTYEQQQYDNWKLDSKPQTMIDEDEDESEVEMEKTWYEQLLDSQDVEEEVDEPYELDDICNECEELSCEDCPYTVNEEE